MRLVIRPAKIDGGRALASLYRWLSQDAAVARYGQVTVQTVSQQPGEMGAADVINAVFADGGAAAGIGSLLIAYRTWRDTRTQAPAFTIEKNGVTVVIDRVSEHEIQQIIHIMLPDVDSQGPSGIAGENVGDTNGDGPAGSGEVSRSSDRNA
jgi:hypothetical protein